ncbi:MAG: cytochrome c-type biogenesis protein CcmH [Hyphomicrobiaceae bacterium]|nr:cytochrome c-type biogenesis protein CcmH [Hyphomicrobiaceae bacterium]
MCRRSRAAALAVSLSVMFGFLSTAAHALDPTERLNDPRLEERARSLSAELRCLVCQNQSIDDSDAPLAKDLRRLVRERLQTGATDTEVKDFVVARYGDFVLLKPPLNMHTLLLWFTPLIVLVLIGAMIWRAMGMRNSAAPAGSGGPRLSADEEKRLAELLRGADDGNGGSSFTQT